MQQRSVRYGAMLWLLLLVSACSSAPISPPQTPSALDPHGPAAAHLADLTWFMTAFGTAVWILVVVLMFAALLRRQRGTSETAPESHGGDTGRRWVVWGGLALPLVILAIVFVYNIYTLAAVENPPGQPAVKINVIGRRWWWEVNYTDQGVITANEIHIPVGVPVQFKLEAADVIHSFWVPQLHGKMDLIPNRINYLTLQADQAGAYRGVCAEFCGLQHAHMDLMVIAQSQSDYNNWLNAQQQSASNPSDQAAQNGQQVFMSVGCVFCHTVRGLDDKSVNASGVRLGPDLTHLSSRLTIAGASLTENTGNLAGWIVDAQHVKPGNLMPNMYLSSQDLHNLLAYLATLK